MRPGYWILVFFTCCLKVKITKILLAHAGSSKYKSTFEPLKKTLFRTRKSVRLEEVSFLWGVSLRRFYCIKRFFSCFCSWHFRTRDFVTLINGGWDKSVGFRKLKNLQPFSPLNFSVLLSTKRQRRGGKRQQPILEWFGNQRRQFYYKIM